MSPASTTVTTPRHPGCWRCRSWPRAGSAGQAGSGRCADRRQSLHAQPGRALHPGARPVRGDPRWHGRPRPRAGQPQGTHAAEAAAGKARQGRPGRGAGRGPLGRPATGRSRRQPGHAGQPARAVLGPDAIAGGRDGWRFVAGPRLTVDLDDAERLVAEAEGRLAGEPALALAAAQRALDLLGRGPVLAEEPDADWAEPSRRAAERLAVHARQAAWRAALAVGDQAGALAHAEAALGADPLDEAAHRAAMHAHLR